MLFPIDDEEQKRVLLHQERALETELQNESSKYQSETAVAQVIKEQEKSIAKKESIKNSLQKLRLCVKADAFLHCCLCRKKRINIIILSKELL